MIQELIHQMKVNISILQFNLFFIVIVEASRNGHLEIVKFLLNDPRVDPSMKNNKGSSKNDWDNIFDSN
jgi:hypothetical protein